MKKEKTKSARPVAAVAALLAPFAISVTGFGAPSALASPDDDGPTSAQVCALYEQGKTTAYIVSKLPAASKNGLRGSMGTSQPPSGTYRQRLLNMVENRCPEYLEIAQNG